MEIDVKSDNWKKESILSKIISQLWNEKKFEIVKKNTLKELHRRLLQSVEDMGHRD